MTARVKFNLSTAGGRLYFLQVYSAPQKGEKPNNFVAIDDGYRQLPESRLCFAILFYNLLIYLITLTFAHFQELKYEYYRI